MLIKINSILLPLVVIFISGTVLQISASDVNDKVGIAQSKTPYFQKGDSTQVNELLDDFLGSDYRKVWRAQLQLESMQEEIIPVLIKMINKHEKVDLINTFDLIYPGAKRFYGHGNILDYDIDWLPDRIGWLLEAITFENFGFEHRGIALEHRNLYDEKNIRAKSEMAVRNAKIWWEENKNNWSRLQAILSALKSNDSNRKIKVLAWLRYGETSCSGFTKKFYEDNVLPLVRKLANPKNDSARDQAKLLLDDKEYYGLSLKLKLIQALNREMKDFFANREPFVVKDSAIEFNSIPQDTKFQSRNELIGPVLNLSLPLSLHKGKMIITIGTVKFVILPDGYSIFQNDEIIYESNDKNFKGINIEKELVSGNKKVAVARLMFPRATIGDYVNIDFPVLITVEIYRGSIGILGQWRR